MHLDLTAVNRSGRASSARTEFQALETLTLAQASAVAKLLRREPDRLLLRDALLVRLASFDRAKRSATVKAQFLADAIQTADPANPDLPLMQLIRSLSRAGRAPCARIIQNALIAAENASV